MPEPMGILEYLLNLFLSLPLTIAPAIPKMATITKYTLIIYVGLVLTAFHLHISIAKGMQKVKKLTIFLSCSKQLEYLILLPIINTDKMEENKPALPKELKWIETTTGLMDNTFRIPFTDFRFGLDPIIGLIPGIGDIATFSVSGLMILAMIRHGITGGLAFKMVGNLLIDTIIGEIPMIGDLFDFANKANRRNLKLLQEYHKEGKHQESGKGLFIAVLLTLFGVLFGVLYGSWKLTAFLWESISTLLS